MGENKQQILDSLLVAIRLTRTCTSAHATDPAGSSMWRWMALDSGIAMLKDVINHIDIG